MTIHSVSAIWILLFAAQSGLQSGNQDLLLLILGGGMVLLIVLLVLLLVRFSRRQRQSAQQELLLRSDMTRMNQDFIHELEQLQQSLAGRVAEASRDQREINALFLGQLQQYNQGNGQMLDNVRRSVSENLNRISGGLQEMQAVALDVRSLRQVLGNVRSRGIIGELQLERLLADILSPAQFDRQVHIRPEKQEAVDFAIRLPGEDETGEPVLLPIDAKFPLDYLNRLLAAQEAADLEAAEVFSRELAARIRQEARKIADLYLVPPKTTDFAILYLPTETLFAEVVRDGELTSEVYRQYKVILAGPSSMTGILAGLQAIFRMQTMEKRSLQIARALTELQRDFRLYEESLERVRTRLVRALAETEDCGRKAGQVRRNLNGLDFVDDREDESEKSKTAEQTEKMENTDGIDSAS